MKISHFSAIVTLPLAIAACGGAPEDGGEDGNAAPVSEAQVEAPVTPAAAPAGPDKGQIAFLKCRSCHTLEEGAPHSTGPNLHGLFGAAAGVKEGYVFTDALASSGIVWNAETLDAWIASPRDMVPGNKMAFAGIPDPEQRAALIEFLERETQ